MLLKYCRFVPLAALLAVLSLPCQAAESLAASRWYLLDEETQQPEALLDFTQERALLQARIIDLLPASGDDPTPLCTQCQGSLKDRPVLGLTVLWDLKTEQAGQWTGQVLDPESGKTYRCQLRLHPDHQHMQLKVYAGWFWQSRDLVRQ